MQEEVVETSTIPVVDIPSYCGWTFGVVSAAELIGILLFSVYIVWAVYAYTLANFNIISKFQLTSKEEWYNSMLL